MAPRREFFLPSFGAHLPNVPMLSDYGQVFFPVPSYTPNGFDLEYTSLLIADGLVLDKFAYEFIRDPSRPQFAPMLGTIERLLAAGYVRIEDYAAQAFSFSQRVEQHVNECLEEPEYWIDTVRNSWKLYQPLRDANIARLGRNINFERESLFFGVLCHLKNISDKFDSQEARRLQGLLDSRRRKFSPPETLDIREIIRPVLTQAVFNRMLSDKLGIPFIDWSDLEPFYRKLTTPTTPTKKQDRPTKEDLDACIHLFTVALPQLKPNSADEVIRFLRAKAAVKSLRDEVHRAIYEGAAFDGRWADKLRDDAAFAQMTYRKRQHVFHWISRVVSFAPGVGSALGAALEKLPEMAEIAVQGLELVGDKAIERNSLSRYQWYYTMVEIKRERS
jgi:hypothetical protein